MIGFGKSVTGKVRRANEDAILVQNGVIGALPNLYIVADGMGGHLAGEIASTMAVTEAKSFLLKNEYYDSISEALSDMVLFANEKIYKNGYDYPERHGMGTTILTVSVSEGIAYIANVGDSRLYVINRDTGKIEQITVDHSYVMELLREGKITAEEAERHPNKNIITRALGTNTFVETDFFSYTIQKGDMLLMCSDGLTNMLSNDEILKICREPEEIEKTVERLLAAANEKGGIDNISVIIYG